MITGNQIGVVIGAAGATDYYVQAPFDCQIGNVRVTTWDTLAASATVTLNDGTQDLGVATFDGTPTAGEKATWVADATYGNRKVSKDATIKLTISAFGTSTDRVFVQIDLDPYAL